MTFPQTVLLIAIAVNSALSTAEKIRKRLVQEGFEAILERRRQVSPSRTRKFDGKGEAQLIKIALSEAPEGRERWTLQMLADEVVRLNIVDSVTDHTIGNTLKK